jgi:hypothetical protein
MSQEKPSTLLTVVQMIEKICTTHVSIKHFDYGDLQKFNYKPYQYPVAYLETVQDLSENSNGSEHTYTITLNIIDLKGTESGYQHHILLQDKLMQIFFEIKSVMQLDYFFSKERVGPADVLVFNDFGDAETIRLRAEFAAEVESVDNNTPDLSEIFPNLF